MKIRHIVVLCLPYILAAQPASAPRTPPIQPGTRAATRSPDPFQGSVAAPDLPSGNLSLSLQDAIQRGLKQNLGLIVGDESTRFAHGQQLRARSALLPAITGRVAESVQQVNLKAFGFDFHFPGVSIPTVVGPFKIFDARAYLTQSLFDLTSLRNSRAAGENVRAAALTNKDGRDLVILLVTTAYLQVLADAARIDEARSEVATAQALSGRAADLLKSGLSPAIDSLRAQVELQSEQTRLRQYQNDYDKDKLTLARLIGLPLEHPFTLSDAAPYVPLTLPTREDALTAALKSRSDYQAAQAHVRAAELTKGAAIAERYPVMAANGDYGDIGPSPINSHGTFTASVGVHVNLFDGGRIRGDIEQADAQLAQRRAELSDLRGRIDLEVRSALLDLETAADQVATTASLADLARRTLTQAQDRFSAGVADNIEVVQAQNSVAAATETYIGSVFAHNIAKASLARALGMADENLRLFLGGK